MVIRMVAAVRMEPSKLQVQGIISHQCIEFLGLGVWSTRGRQLFSAEGSFLMACGVLKFMTYVKEATNKVPEVFKKSECHSTFG